MSTHTVAKLAVSPVVYEEIYQKFKALNEVTNGQYNHIFMATPNKDDCPPLNLTGIALIVRCPNDTGGDGDCHLCINRGKRVKDCKYKKLSYMEDKE